MQIKFVAVSSKFKLEEEPLSRGRDASDFLQQELVRLPNLRR
jgi:hypothetical protein